MTDDGMRRMWEMLMDVGGREAWEGVKEILTDGGEEGGNGWREKGEVEMA